MPGPVPEAKNLSGSHPMWDLGIAIILNRIKGYIGQVCCLCS